MAFALLAHVLSPLAPRLPVQAAPPTAFTGELSKDTILDPLYASGQPLAFGNRRAKRSVASPAEAPPKDELAHNYPLNYVVRNGAETVDLINTLTKFGLDFSASLSAEGGEGGNNALTDFYRSLEAAKRTNLVPADCISMLEKFQKLAHEAVTAKFGSDTLPPDWLKLVSGADIFAAAINFCKTTSAASLDVRAVREIVIQNILADQATLISEIGELQKESFMDMLPQDYISKMRVVQFWHHARRLMSIGRVAIELERELGVDGGLPRVVDDGRIVFNHMVDVTPEANRWHAATSRGLHNSRLNDVLQRLSYQALLQDLKDPNINSDFNFRNNKYSLKDTEVPTRFVYEDFKSGNQFSVRRITRDDGDYSVLLSDLETPALPLIYQVVHNKLGVRLDAADGAVEEREFIWIVEELLDVPSDRINWTDANAVKGVIHGVVRGMKMLDEHFMVNPSVTVDNIAGRLVRPQDLAENQPKIEGERIVYKIAGRERIEAMPQAKIDFAPIEYDWDLSANREAAWSALGVFARSLREKIKNLIEEPDIAETFKLIVGADYDKKKDKPPYAEITEILKKFDVPTPKLKKTLGEAPKRTKIPHQAIHLVDPQELDELASNRRRAKFNLRGLARS